MMQLLRMEQKKVQKEARAIKQLICVTIQLRICLMAFMLLQVLKGKK